MELPFGENPFAKKATPSVSATVATASPPAVAKTKTVPPPAQRSRKRPQVTILDPSRGDNSKKSKAAVSESSSAVMILGDLVKDNFKDEDVSGWMKRGKVEAGFCFKQALGETFFHGLDLLNSLEGENSRLQASLTNATNSHDYYKGLVEGAEKTVEDERLVHKGL